MRKKPVKRKIIVTAGKQGFKPMPGINEETKRLRPEDQVMQITAYKHQGKVYETLEEALAATSARVFHETISAYTFQGVFDATEWLDHLRGNETDRLHVINFIKSLKP